MASGPFVDAKGGHLKRASHFLDYATGGLGAVAEAHDGLPFYHRHGLLGEQLRGATVPQRALTWSRESAQDLMREFLDYDRDTRFVGEYLTKVDGGAMHYAVEARSPFLDQELWNYAAGLPFGLRLHRGSLKAILREISRRRVSDAVAGGAKRGHDRSASIIEILVEDIDRLALEVKYTKALPEPKKRRIGFKAGKREEKD